MSGIHLISRQNIPYPNNPCSILNPAHPFLLDSLFQLLVIPFFPKNQTPQLKMFFNKGLNLQLIWQFVWCCSTILHFFWDSQCFVITTPWAYLRSSHIIKQFTPTRSILTVMHFEYHFQNTTLIYAHKNINNNNQ